MGPYLGTNPLQREELPTAMGDQRVWRAIIRCSASTEWIVSAHVSRIRFCFANRLGVTWGRSHSSFESVFRTRMTDLTDRYPVYFPAFSYSFALKWRVWAPVFVAKVYAKYDSSGYASGEYKKCQRISICMWIHRLAKPLYYLFTYHSLLSGNGAIATASTAADSSCNDGYHKLNQSNNAANRVHDDAAKLQETIIIIIILFIFVEKTIRAYW